MKRLLATIPALLLSACGFAASAPAADASYSFYRVESIDGLDTFVAPDGSPFFAAGVCHVHTRGSHSHALGYSPYKRFVEANYPSPDAWADETAAKRTLRLAVQMAGLPRLQGIRVCVHRAVGTRGLHGERTAARPRCQAKVSLICLQHR